MLRKPTAVLEVGRFPFRIIWLWRVGGAFLAYPFSPGVEESIGMETSNPQRWEVDASLWPDPQTGNLQVRQSNACQETLAVVHFPPAAVLRALGNTEAICLSGKATRDLVNDIYWATMIATLAQCPLPAITGISQNETVAAAIDCLRNGQAPERLLTQHGQKN